MKNVGYDSIQSWKVMAAIFVIKFLTMGLIETAGMLMVVSVYSFNVSREEASLPFTLVYCVRNVSGPLIGYIGYIIGTPSATLLGCIISSLAVGCCFFAKSILAVTVLWGILLGIGMAFGILFLNAIIIEHFEKHLSKATGIAGSGVQLGTTFYSLILGSIIDAYGLSGAFLISSGLILNCIPASLIIIFNQPKQYIRTENTPKPNYIYDPTDVNTRLDSHEYKNDVNDELKLQVGCDMKTKPDERITKEGRHEMYSQIQNESSKQEMLCNNNQRRKHLAAEDNDKHAALKNALFERQDFSLNNSHECDNSPKCLDKQIKRFPSYTDKDPYPTLKNEIIREAIEIPYEASSACKHHSLLPKSQPQKQKYVLIRLFGDPLYLLILCSGGMYYFASLTFLTILVDHTIDINFPVPYTKYVLVWYSISELLGGILLGYITDNGLLTYNGFASLCFFAACLSTICIIHANHYILLALLITVHQFGVSGLTFDYSAIIKESITKDLRPPALASLFVLAAPLSLSVLPLIGYFKDKHGSYAGVFYTIAASELLGFLIHFLIPVLNKYRKQYKSKECPVTIVET